MNQLVTNIDKQMQRAMGMLRDGDRAPYFLPGKATFFSGQNTPVRITFAVPADGDFYGDMLSVYLEARACNAAGVPSEETFRSCDWTCTNDIPATTGTALVSTDEIGSVSGFWELALPEQYENQATSANALFSARHGHSVQASTLGAARQPWSVFPSGMQFHTPLFIPRGTGVSLTFMPGYAKAPAEGTTEYRISAFLEGFKKVKTLLGV